MRAEKWIIRFFLKTFALSRESWLAFHGVSSDAAVTFEWNHSNTFSSYCVSLTQDDQLRYRIYREYNNSITAASKVRLRRADISKVVRDKKTICVWCRVISNSIIYIHRRIKRVRLIHSITPRRATAVCCNFVALITFVRTWVILFCAVFAKVKSCYDKRVVTMFLHVRQMIMGYRFKFLIKGRVRNSKIFNDSFLLLVLKYK